MGNGISSALDELDKAMDSLETAVNARVLREEGLAEAEAEVQRMGADRTRLAESLDGAEARTQVLENANREVSKRIVDAMESIRTVLDNK